MEKIIYQISPQSPKKKVVFKCECGSNDFNRPSEISYLRGDSFFEGYFECSLCKAQHNYTSDAFHSTEITTKQLSLF